MRITPEACRGGLGTDGVVSEAGEIEYRINGIGGVAGREIGEIDGVGR